MAGYNRHERGCGAPPGERHRSERTGWLRAAVLGANDGIVSTASLVVGVAAAASARQDLLIAGVASVEGALSNAAGEYVSVSSQVDTLTYPGIRNVEHEYFYAVHGVDDATRRGYLEKAYALGLEF